MQLLDKVRRKAKKRSKRIALPESGDGRVLKAAEEATSLSVARIALIGDEEKIRQAAAVNSVRLDGIDIVNPLTSARLDEFAGEFHSRRKHKGMTGEEAKGTVERPLYFAAMMTKAGDVDGFVAGAVETSADVGRAAIYCVGIDGSAGTLSSAFVIIFPDTSLGEQGAFIFADCGIVPDPSARQLAGIAFSSGNLFRFLFEKEPRVAMLSYSTRGSGKGPMVEKVVEATAIAKKLYPDMAIDGELQLDSAVTELVAKRKCPDSPVGGRANVLVFPDLNSGNIAYKLAERLGGARAVGPLLQGLSRPCSDLSRGCSVRDIVDTIALTAIRES